MKRNIVSSLFLGALFVLYFILEYKGLERYPDDYTVVVKIAVCSSLFLLPVIVSVILYCSKDTVLYGILIVLTALAVSFPRYVPFMFSLHYLPALYLLTFFSISARNKRNGVSDKKSVIPLYAVCLLLLAYILRLIWPVGQDGSLKQGLLYTALLFIIVAFVAYRLVFRYDTETILKNSEHEVWFHYFVLLAMKFFVLCRSAGGAYATIKATYVFYNMDFWLFVPDFLFLIGVVGLSTERKLNLNFITESMSEN